MTLRWLAHGMSDVPAADGWLAPGEAARLERMRFAKRRTEWRLGRWTAKQAIARALELAPGDHAALAALDIRIAPDGAPDPHVGEVPAPLAISMTDRADWAVCVVAPRTVGVGCDLELVEPRTERFIHDYLTAAERDWVLAAPLGDARDERANLVWSAKESALKVLRTGLRRDTRSIEVELATIGGGRWAPLVARAQEGGQFFGWWRRFGSFVLTVASTVEGPEPASFQQPSRLSVAEPTHGWMEAPSPPPLA